MEGPRRLLWERKKGLTLSEWELLFWDRDFAKEPYFRRKHRPKAEDRHQGCWLSRL